MTVRRRVAYNAAGYALIFAVPWAVVIGLGGVVALIAGWWT